MIEDVAIGTIEAPMEDADIYPIEGPPELKTTINKFKIHFVEANCYQQFIAQQHQPGCKMVMSTLPVFLAECDQIQGRKFTIEYKSVCAECFVVLDRNSEATDFEGKCPHFLVCLEGTPKIFSQSRVISGRATFKKFGSFQLRIPQEEALLKMKSAFEGNIPCTADLVLPPRFMIILPTGCGKTFVMGLAPFLLNATTVLVVTPNKTICDQVIHALSNLFANGSPLSNSIGGDMPTVGGFNPKVKNLPYDIVVANVQALVKGGKSDMDDELYVPKIGDAASELLDARKFDVCLIDEGHHCPAQSWQVVEKRLFELNSNCRTVLLTATPMRGDGLTYKLPNAAYYYLFRREQAIRDSYIKYTTYCPIEFEFQAHSTKYCNKPYLEAMLDPAVQKLKELRASCGGIPLRMLVTVRDNKSANTTSDFFNERSQLLGWNLKSAAITGATTGTNLNTKEGFECKENTHKHFVDVVMQCQMLGEGYDNPMIAISVFVAPPGSVGVLAQFHGRALRILKTPNVANMPQTTVSHLFYPKWEKVQSVVEEYQCGKDESTEYLFDASIYRTLKEANTKLGKLKTAEIVVALRTNFTMYHEQYSEKRKSWRCIPAEHIAEDIYGKHISDHATSMKIVDFGCGEDGLFEVKLSELLKTRDVSFGPIEVEVLALDVVAFAGADDLSYTSGNVRFSCKTDACDYSATLVNDQFDLGVFCLSMMATDALEMGLLQAMNLVKPGNKIIIVQDLYKFDLFPGQPPVEKKDSLVAWSKKFTERTGFRVLSIDIIPRSIHVLLEILNVTCDLNTTVAGKLKGLSFRSLIKGAASPSGYASTAEAANCSSEFDSISGLKRAREEAVEEVDMFVHDACVSDGEYA